MNKITLQMGYTCVHDLCLSTGQEKCIFYGMYRSKKVVFLKNKNKYKSALELPIKIPAQLKFEK